MKESTSYITVCYTTEYHFLIVKSGRKVTITLYGIDLPNGSVIFLDFHTIWELISAFRG